MKASFVLFFVLVFHITGVAQTRVFTGRVVDSKQNGVPFAVIAAKERHEGVYTDEKGYFSFITDVSTFKTLEVICLGFERKEILWESIQQDPILQQPIIIELKTKVSTLKTVEIVANRNDRKKGILGKSRRALRHDGDCYRFYGSETAIKLKADTAHHQAKLNTIYVYVTNEGDYKTKFRIHVYRWDDVPTTEITDSNLVVQAGEPNSWVKVDVSKKNIPVGEGLFVSVEWVSGFGNSQRSLQSEFNPEVTDYNGQVLGLTTDYGKPSRTYSRKPFSKKWIYYDAYDAQRKGGYFLNPMIYCAYEYTE